MYTPTRYSLEQQQPHPPFIETCQVHKPRGFLTGTVYSTSTYVLLHVLVKASEDGASHVKVSEVAPTHADAKAPSPGCL